MMLRGGVAMANAENRLIELAEAAARLPTKNEEIAASGVAAIEFNNAITPQLIAAAMRVVGATRAYFQHHVSQAPHAPHVQMVLDALADFDSTAEEES